MTYLDDVYDNYVKIECLREIADSGYKKMTIISCPKSDISVQEDTLMQVFFDKYEARFNIYLNGDLRWKTTSRKRIRTVENIIDVTDKYFDSRDSIFYKINGNSLISETIGSNSKPSISKITYSDTSYRKIISTLYFDGNGTTAIQDYDNFGNRIKEIFIVENPEKTNDTLFTIAKYNAANQVTEFYTIAANKSYSAFFSNIKPPFFITYEYDSLNRLSKEKKIEYKFRYNAGVSEAFESITIKTIEYTPYGRFEYITKNHDPQEKEFIFDYKVHNKRIFTENESIFELEYLSPASTLIKYIKYQSPYYLSEVSVIWEK